MFEKVRVVLLDQLFFWVPPLSEQKIFVKISVGLLFQLFFSQLFSQKKVYVRKSQSCFVGSAFFGLPPLSEQKIFVKMSVGLLFQLFLSQRSNTLLQDTKERRGYLQERRGKTRLFQKSFPEYSMISQPPNLMLLLQTLTLR